MDAASRQKRFAGDGKVKNKIRLPEDYRDRERIGPDKKINAVTVLGYRKRNCTSKFTLYHILKNSDTLESQKIRTIIDFHRGVCQSGLKTQSDY